MAGDVALSPAVQAVSKRFALVDGKPQMSTDDLKTSWSELCQLPPEARSTTVVELVALAMKFQRLAGSAGGVAIAQLFTLSAHMLEDLQQVTVMFQSAGVDLENSARFIGQEASKLPVAGGRATDKNSLFSLRLGLNKPSKP